MKSKTLAAWLAFLAMGWRILRGNAEERRRYLLIWLWTGAYFAWQSISVTRTMRYQMPTYPLLTVIAGMAFLVRPHFANSLS